GARVVAGYRLLSGEIEYTRGQSDANYPLTDLRIEETTERVRAGIRSTYDLGSILSFTGRGGAEIGRRNTESTTAGVTTKSESPTRVDPYVGAGIGIHLGKTLSLNAEALATIKDVKDMN